MFIRALRGNEYLYAYANHNDIQAKTGFIGHLRCDFGKLGKEFHYTPFLCETFKNGFPQNFPDALNNIVDCLRGINKGFDKENQILRDRQAMEKFVNKRSNEEFLLPNSTEKYGLRSDYEGFTFIINFYPQPGDYNAYIYCYITEYLDEHIKNASKGISFTDSEWNEIFRLEDGGRIIITEPDGRFHSENCRYIDDYHFVTASGNVYHIHQYAELMARNGNTVKPQGEVF